MMAIRTTYEEVGFTVSKSGKCPVCGKPARRTEKFYQTLNPWNKNKDGSIKSRNQIIKEVNQKIKEWKGLPVLHAKCE